MKVSSMYIRVVTRKMQNGSIQFVLLGGFARNLTYSSAEYFETMGTADALGRQEYGWKIDRMMKSANAAATVDVTDVAMQKKLDKLFI